MHLATSSSNIIDILLTSNPLHNLATLTPAISLTCSLSDIMFSVLVLVKNQQENKVYNNYRICTIFLPLPHKK